MQDLLNKIENNMLESQIMEDQMMEILQEVTPDELDKIIGAGKNGVFNTISHECHMNSWQFMFTCCS